MADNINRRLDRLERHSTPATAYRVHWRNDIDAGNAAIYQDDRGTWYDRDTGQRIDVLEIHWPDNPNLTGGADA